MVKEGWLKKLGNVNKKWKKRWFTLNKYQQLKYYEDNKRMKFLGIIDCKLILSVTNGKIYGNDMKYTMELNTKQRVWIIAAKDENDRVNV